MLTVPSPSKSKQPVPTALTNSSFFSVLIIDMFINCYHVHDTSYPPSGFLWLYMVLRGKFWDISLNYITITTSAVLSM
jgi:hypothetical protein